MWTVTAGDGSQIAPEMEQQWTVTKWKIKTSESRGKFKSQGCLLLRDPEHFGKIRLN